jgi:NADP-dependent 3-hydroxy acid dehydrogenase YdfG
MSMKSLKGLVTVITGASSGIGLETARLLAGHGCRLALLARSADKLAAVETELQAAGAEVCAVAADVADEGAVQAAFARIGERFGDVDILINGAGVGFATDLARCPLADYRRILETNVTGVFLCNRAVLPRMRERKSGHIVNISSVVGKTANPTAPLYCASKFALNGYSSGLQQQVAADRVRVSLVSPSSVDTAYWAGRPVDRSKFLTAAEVAGVIHFVIAQPDGVLIKDVDLTALR